MVGASIPSQAATVAGGTYQENDSSVTYTGTSGAGAWSRADTTGNNTDSGDGFSSATIAGASASLTFSSTEVSWIGRTSAFSGKADVYIDGVVKASGVDQYSTSTQFQQTIYKATGLTNATHTIKIVRTGTKNSSSGGSGINLDAFKVYDTVTPAAPANVRASATRTGALVSWAAPAGVNVASYQLYRAVGLGTRTLVATLPASTTSFDDIGLASATGYTFSVTLTTATERVSPAASVAFTTPAGPVETTNRYANCPSPTVTVRTGAQLQTAITAAQPGDVIRAYTNTTPGAYTFANNGTLQVTGKAGTASQPIWICGTPSLVLQFAGVDTNGGIKVEDSSYINVAGMTVQDSQKGVSVINSNHVVIADMHVQSIGQEAIHLKNQTTDSVVIGNTISQTGLQTVGYGEGVYIGTAQGNWGQYNNGLPDASNRDTIVSNTISQTTAELIEAKEGSVDGRIANNTLNGAGMVNPDGGDSPIAIQSSGWVVSDNTITNAPTDGVQVWQVGDYGYNNLVFRNQFNDTIPHYSVQLAAKADELGDIVGCDNTVAPGGAGLSNKTCQP